MRKWKEMSSNEKWMIVIILLLLLGIITRWKEVRNSVTDSFSLFTRTEQRSSPE